MKVDMDDGLTSLSAQALSNDGRITRLFREAGVDDFAGAARYSLKLPYGRIADRNRFWLVLTEGRGTCTTKHALLAELAREQAIDVQLMLGIYEMNERSTPGVGHVLSKYGMEQKLPMHPILVFADLIYCDRLFVEKAPDGLRPDRHSGHIDAASIQPEIAVCLGNR